MGVIDVHGLVFDVKYEYSYNQDLADVQLQELNVCTTQLIRGLHYLVHYNWLQASWPTRYSGYDARSL